MTLPVEIIVNIASFTQKRTLFSIMLSSKEIYELSIKLIDFKKLYLAYNSYLTYNSPRHLTDSRHFRILYADYVFTKRCFDCNKPITADTYCPDCFETAVDEFTADICTLV